MKKRLPAAGGFADDLHGHARRVQSREQRRTSRRIVRKAPGAALEVEVEGGFGDVESGVDEGWFHGRSRLSLVNASSDGSGNGSSSKTQGGEVRAAGRAQKAPGAETNFSPPTAGRR